MDSKKLSKAANLILKKSVEYDERATKPAALFATSYLQFFGYLAVEALSRVTADDIANAVKLFQGWFGLKKDGIVGPKTLRAMRTPRCGCPDIIDPNNPDHVGYAQLVMRSSQPEELNQWRKKGLTYAIRSYVKGIAKTEQDDIFAGAWKAWDRHCGISISRASSASKADLLIDTGSGSRHNFDGPSGTLAWAYLPSGNDSQLLMRFDLDETWITNKNTRGVLLFNVAAHEFGHMLGLTHSKKSGALMAPYYNAAVAVPQADDDIPRVVARYGPEVVETPPQVPAPGNPTDGEIDYVIRVKSRDLRIDGYTLFRVAGG